MFKVKLSYLIKKLRSLRVTIFLVICIAIIFLAGVIIPQKDLLGESVYLRWKSANPGLVSFLETLRLTDIYTSPIVLTLWVLFFLNLILIMSNRIPLIWKKCFRRTLPLNIDTVKNSKHYTAIDSIDINNIISVLKEKGYSVFIRDSAFSAAKNRFSPLATILFHLSFFLLLIGGVLSFYSQFKGTAELAVGETFEGYYKWSKKPIIGDIPGTTFTVSDIKTTYYKKTVPVNVEVVLETKKGKEVIGINRPYKEGQLSFVIKTIDIAPLFIITNSSGKEVDGAYVKLRGLGGKESRFKMLDYEFRTIFFADYSAVKSGLKDKADVPQVLKQIPINQNGLQQPREVIDPAFRISVFKNGVLLTSKTIKKGREIDFDGYRLIFSDFVYWVDFYVVEEYGLGIIYTGFILMIISLLVRFMLFRRDIMGIIENSKLHIGGRGEFYPALFEEEFKGIVNKLE